jgi:hypothetical protein
VDYIVGTAVAVLGLYALPLLAPLALRFPRRAVARGALLCVLASAVGIGVFCMRSPFDKMHKRRVFVLHMHNVCCCPELPVRS